MKTGYPMIALALLATFASVGQAQDTSGQSKANDASQPLEMIAKAVQISVVNGMLDVQFLPGFPDSVDFGNIDVSVDRRPDGTASTGQITRLPDGWQNRNPAAEMQAEAQGDQIVYSPNSIRIRGTLAGTPDLEFNFLQANSAGRGAAGAAQPFVIMQVVEIPANGRHALAPSPGRGQAGTGFTVPGMIYRANFAAGSFDDLRKQHPDEVSEYLIPMLRELRLDLNLQGDAFEVVQVFPRMIDASTVKRVKELIAQLDADSADDRDTASATLATMGSPAVVIMLQTDPATFSPEQALRVANLCGSKKLLTEDEIAARKRDPAFLAACLQDSGREGRVAALAALRAVLGYDVDFDVDADAAGRAAAIKKLGLLPSSRP